MMFGGDMTPGEKKWYAGETVDYEKRNKELNSALKRMEYWTYRWHYSRDPRIMFDAQERVITYLVRVLELSIEAHFDLPPVGPELLDSLAAGGDYASYLRHHLPYYFDFRDYIEDVINQQERRFESLYGVRIPTWDD